MEHSSPDFPGLNASSRRIWNRNAAFWNRRMGEGNAFHSQLVAPSTQRLLALKPGEVVLDIGCGNGQFAREMARQGARVVAFDFSKTMIRLARSKRAGSRHPIEYRVVDAARPAQLLALGAGRFDAAVCTMAIMDMAEISPLLKTLPRLLKPDGRFVFSVLHPCFNSSRHNMLLEEATQEGRYAITASVKVSKYLTLATAKGEAMLGQPEAQHYFERPLTTLFDSCFRAGFLMDGIKEPSFKPGVRSKRAVAWDGRFSDIPPVLVARMRPR